MIAFVERVTGVHWKDQGPVALVSLGHGGTHWIQAATFLVLPFIAEAMNFSYTQAGLLISISQLSFGIGNISAGAVVDVTGRRAMMLVVALAVGSVMFGAMAAAPGFATLVLALVAVGFTLTLWHPAALPLLSEMHPKARGYVLAVHSLGASLGDAFGPLFVGTLLGVMAWRETVVLTALVPFLLAGILAVTIARSAKSVGSKGIRLREYFAGFRDLLGRRKVLILCLSSGMRTMSMIVLYTFIPLYLKNDLLFAPFWMGAVMMAFQAGGFVMTPGISVLSDRIGCRPVYATGLFIVAGLLIALPLAQGIPMVMVAVTVMGCALFSIRPVGQSWLIGLVPRNLGGTGTSLMFAMQSSLSAVGTTMGGAIADHFGLTSVFLFVAGLTVVSGILSLFVPEPDAVS